MENTPWPDFPELWSHALIRTKQNWKQLLYLNIITMVSMVIFGALIAGLFAFMFAASLQFGTLSSNPYLAGIVVLAIVIVMVIIVNVMAIASILIVGASVPKPLLAVIRQSFSYLPGFLGVTLLVVFFMLGGFALLLIPGLVLLFFLSYWSFGYVLEGKRGLDAVKFSVQVVSQNASPIFLFGIAVGAIYVAYGLVFDLAQKLLLSQAPAAIPGHMVLPITVGAVVIALIRLVGTVGLSILIQNIMYEVYVAAKSHTDFARPSSVRWMWIVSSLGWLCIIGIIIFTLLLPRSATAPTYRYPTQTLRPGQMVLPKY